MRGEGLKGGGDSRHGDDNNPGRVQMVLWSLRHTGYGETYTNAKSTMCC